MEKDKKTKWTDNNIHDDGYRHRLETLAALDLRDVACIKYVLPEGKDLVVCDRCTCDRDADQEPSSTADTEWLKTMTGPADFPLPDVTSLPIDDAVANPEAYDSERTFGASRAPWVGAENIWREGRVPPPHASPLRYSGGFPEAIAPPRKADDIFTTDELAMVVSTAPPPPRKKRGRMVPVFRTVIVAALGVAVSWAIFAFNQSTKAKTEVASVSPANQAAFMAPAVVSSEAAADPLPLHSETYEKALPSRAEGEALEPAVTETVAVTVQEAPQEVAVPEKPFVKMRARTALAPVPAAEKEAISEVTSPEEKNESAPVNEEAPSTAALAAESETPAPSGDASSKTAADGSMAAILMEAKTKTPEAKVYNDELGVLLVGNPAARAEAALKPLSPAAVRQTLSTLAPQVKRCGNGMPGRIVMDIVVSGSTGRVLDATPKTKEHVGTPTGICASRAMKLAKFPKSKLARQHVEYTFDLE